MLFTNRGYRYDHRRFQTTDGGIRLGNRRNPLPATRPSLAAAVLCLAELRSLSGFPRAAALPAILANQVGRALVLGHGLPSRLDCSSRNPRRRWRVPAALIVQVDRRRGSARLASSLGSVGAGNEAHGGWRLLLYIHPHHGRGARAIAAPWVYSCDLLNKQHREILLRV